MPEPSQSATQNVSPQMKSAYVESIDGRPAISSRAWSAAWTSVCFQASDSDSDSDSYSCSEQNGGCARSGGGTGRSLDAALTSTNARHCLEWTCPLRSDGSMGTLCFEGGKSTRTNPGGKIPASIVRLSESSNGASTRGPGVVSARTKARKYIRVLRCFAVSCSIVRNSASCRDDPKSYKSTVYTEMKRVSIAPRTKGGIIRFSFQCRSAWMAWISFRSHRHVVLSVATTW